jgi:quercetin dioxygenase-like cupin family protein
MKKILLCSGCLMLIGASIVLAQAVGGPEKGKPVTGDPGISSMNVMERPDFRVLRDWAEPGAVRRMHNHPNTTYHVLTLVTGQLRLTVEGKEPIDVKQGDVVELPGGANHTFVNTGTVTATIVEVFGKKAP